MSKAYNYPYQLESVGDLGHLHGKSGIKGNLLKLNFEEYDYPLYLDAPDYSYSFSKEKIISELKSQKLSSQLQLMLDASGKVFKNEYDIKQISKIKNHTLVTDLENFKISDNYSGATLKLKAKNNLEKLNHFLVQVTNRVQASKIRIDFNLALTFDQFTHWWTKLDKNLKNSIDFIEDPFEWSPDHWEQALKINAPLANDFAIDFVDLNKLDDPNHYFKFVIVKPYSGLNIEVLNKMRNLDIQCIFTHGMETQVGRSIASQIATDFANTELVHGFSTGPFFKDDFKNLNKIKELKWTPLNEHV